MFTHSQAYYHYLSCVYVFTYDDGVHTHIYVRINTYIDQYIDPNMNIDAQIHAYYQ